MLKQQLIYLLLQLLLVSMQLLLRLLGYAEPL